MTEVQNLITQIEQHEGRILSTGGADAVYSHFAPLVEERDRLVQERDKLQEAVVSAGELWANAVQRDQLQAILARIHEALGESEHSDDETLPGVVEAEVAARKQVQAEHSQLQARLDKVLKAGEAYLASGPPAIGDLELRTSKAFREAMKEARGK